MSIAKVETSLTHVPSESGSDPTAMGKKNLFTFPKKDEAEGTFYIMFCILAEPGETS